MSYEKKRQFSKKNRNREYEKQIRYLIILKFSLANNLDTGKDALRRIKMVFSTAILNYLINPKVLGGRVLIYLY